MTGPPDFRRRLRLDSEKFGILVLTNMAPVTDIGAGLLNQPDEH
jgi:hypothetical protein